MSESSSKYGILVAVDGSPESDAALRWAAAEAVMRAAPVTLVHGASNPGRGVRLQTEPPVAHGS